MLKSGTTFVTPTSHQPAGTQAGSGFPQVYNVLKPLSAELKEVATVTRARWVAAIGFILAVIACIATLPGRERPDHAPFGNAVGSSKPTDTLSSKSLDLELDASRAAIQASANGCQLKILDPKQALGEARGADRLPVCARRAIAA